MFLIARTQKEKKIVLLWSCMVKNHDLAYYYHDGDVKIIMIFPNHGQNMIKFTISRRDIL